MEKKIGLHTFGDTTLFLIKTANCFIRNLRNNVFIRILSRRKLFYNRMSISLVLGNVWISWISEGVRSI